MKLNEVYSKPLKDVRRNSHVKNTEQKSGTGTA